MKRFLKYFAILLIVLFLGLYWLLFTDSGNKTVANYAQGKLDEKLPGLMIKDFKLRPSSLNLQLDYADFVDINVSGELKLASLSLNLVYSIDSKNLDKLGIKEQINAKGKIIGRYDDLTITGQGEILTSALDFSTQLKDFSPAASKLKITNADLGKLAKIANLPILTGLLSADINAQNLEQVDAKINGYLNFLPAADEMSSLALSSLGKINLNAEAKSADKGINGELKLSSKTLNINLTNIKYEDEVLSATAEANMSNLKWLNPQLNSDLKLFAQLKNAQNSLEISANIKGKNLNANDLHALIDLNTKSAEITGQIRADSRLLNLPSSTLADAAIKAKIAESQLALLEANGIALGGNLIAKLADNRLSASIKYASIDQLLAISQAPRAISGHFDAEANIHDFAQLAGKFSAQIDAKTEPKYFQEIAQLAIASPLGISISGELKGAENISLSAKAKSALIDELNMNAKLANSTLSATYDANAQLANFNRLLDKNMNGKIAVNGELNASKDALSATLLSEDFLGAKLNASLKNEQFNASLLNAQLPRFAKAFDFADVYAAAANAQISYNLKTASGHVHADLAQGHLQPHPVLKLIDALLGKSIENIVFSEGKFDSNISAGTASIDAQLKALNAELAAASGRYVMASKSLDLPLALRLGNTNIKGKFAGSQGKIKFIPDAENTINNVLNLFNKPNRTAKSPQDEAAAPAAPDLGSKQGREEAAKALINGLFNK